MFDRHDEALSELIIREGLVRLEDFEGVKQRARATSVAVANLLLEEGWVTREALLGATARYLKAAGPEELPTQLAPDLARELPANHAREFGVVPLRVLNGELWVAALDPLRGELLPDLGFVLGRQVRLVVAEPMDVERLLRRHYDDAWSGMESAVEREFSVADLESMASEAPVVRLVNRVLTQAVLEQASDVHFEPFESDFRIRARVHGTMREFAPPPRSLALPIASRLKVLADLDIAQRRQPQDGRIRAAFAGRLVDLRVSTLPTQFGESVVLRVLDQSAVQLELSQLGLPNDVADGLRAAIRRPNGIMLVAGPTSSGKTTTLYSALREINSVGSKLLTAEDPVEYELEGVVQVAMNPAIGLTFATAMRAFLRQDPDVIMVGEIRDLETAQVATQAALTGHLVLSTLHTNDAPSTVARLLDLGVEPFLVASTLRAVLAQRLLRRICPACRRVEIPSEEKFRQANLASAELAGRNSFHGAGCAACNQTGYRGRLGIFEWLPMTDALRDAVITGASALELRHTARAAGMRTLREDGLRAAFAGETTFDEVLKYT